MKKSFWLALLVVIICLGIMFYELYLGKNPVAGWAFAAAFISLIIAARLNPNFFKKWN